MLQEADAKAKEAKDKKEREQAASAPKGLFGGLIVPKLQVDSDLSIKHAAFLSHHKRDAGEAARIFVDTARRQVYGADQTPMSSRRNSCTRRQSKLLTALSGGTGNLSDAVARVNSVSDTQVAAAAPMPMGEVSRRSLVKGITSSISFGAGTISNRLSRKRVTMKATRMGSTAPGSPEAMHRLAGTPAMPLPPGPAPACPPPPGRSPPSRRRSFNSGSPDSSFSASPANLRGCARSSPMLQSECVGGRSSDDEKADDEADDDDEEEEIGGVGGLDKLGEKLSQHIRREDFIFLDSAVTAARTPNPHDPAPRPSDALPRIRMRGMTSSSQIEPALGRRPCRGFA